MKIELIQKNKLLHNIPTVLLMALVITLPLSIKLSNILLVAFLLSALLQPGFFLNIRQAFYNKNTFLLMLFFMLHVIGVIYSNNIPMAFSILERLFGFFLIPLFIAGIRPSVPINKDQLLLGFSIGLVLTCSYLGSTYLVKLFTTDNINAFYFFRELSYEYVNLHPSYLALYLSFGIIVLLEMLPRIKNMTLIIANILGILLMASIILLSGARMPIAAFIIIMSIFFILKIKNRLNRWAVTATLFILLPVAGYFSFKIHVVQQRFFEIKETPLNPPLGLNFNSVNLRVAQFLCSKDLIIENFILGLGTGDVQDGLNSCYSENGWSEALYQRSYNAHNQYLQTWLTIGLPGVLLLVFMFVKLSAYALKKKDLVFFSFILLFMLCNMTESLFERNKGIIFFVLFASIFSLFPVADLNKSELQAPKADPIPDLEER